MYLTSEMADLYTIFVNYVEKIVETENLVFFKGVPDFQYMLEHVSARHGADYLELLGSTPITTEQIKTYCCINDRIGAPMKASYSVGSVSPTSLRYLYHAHLALTHFKESVGAKPFHIVEVGGGYGGLCLAISFLASSYGVQIASYTIVDLDPIGALQKLYLAEHSLEFPVEFVSASTYGRDIQAQPLALISNYCFSEIQEEHRQRYIEELLPKTSAGFLAWNNIDVYPIGKTLRVEMERPMTGGKNRFVYF